MTQPRRDNAASVKQRLLNVAHVLDEEFEQVLVRYVAERFLFRLSKSYHADSFLLKGAMLFVAWEGLPHRVTRDVDLLGLGEPSVDRVADMMRDIALQPVEDDGIKFDIASVEAEEIRTAQDYGGVRVGMRSRCGRSRSPSCACRSSPTCARTCSSAPARSTRSTTSVGTLIRCLPTRLRAPMSASGCRASASYRRVRSRAASTSSA